MVEKRIGETCQWGREDEKEGEKTEPRPHTYTHTQQRANKGNPHEREPTDTGPVQAKEMETWAEEESLFQQARGLVGMPSEIVIVEL